MRFAIRPGGPLHRITEFAGIHPLPAVYLTLQRAVKEDYPSHQAIASSRRPPSPHYHLSGCLRSWPERDDDGHQHGVVAVDRHRRAWTQAPACKDWRLRRRGQAVVSRRSRYWRWSGWSVLLAALSGLHRQSERRLGAHRRPRHQAQPAPLRAGSVVAAHGAIPGAAVAALFLLTTEIPCGHRPARLGRSSEAVHGPQPDVTFHPAEGDTAQVCGWQAEAMQRPADGRDARSDRLAHHAAKRGGRHVRIRQHIRAGGHVSR